MLSEGQSFSVVQIFPYVSSNLRYFCFDDPKTGAGTCGGRISFSFAQQLISSHFLNVTCIKRQSYDFPGNLSIADILAVPTSRVEYLLRFNCWFYDA